MEGFREYLVRKGLDEGRSRSAVANALEFEGHLARSDSDIRNCEKVLLDRYLESLIAEGRNEPERLVDMARYCAFRSRPDLFIHLAAMINSYDILPLMERRLRDLHGNDKCEAVFHGFVRPPLGTSTDSYPSLTSRIVRRMEEELSPAQVRSLLTWNYHEIPPETFKDKKQRFEVSASIDDFLASEHNALVEELRERLRNGQMWYEQEVTQEFIDEVAANQMVQTGVREGDLIIIEKVPFDPKHFYGEKDPRMRRYYYCHCPLVRSSITEGRPKVSSSFCNCSAGFAKLPWDVIFGEETEAKVLRSVLDGDEKCLISVRIPDGKRK